MPTMPILSVSDFLATTNQVLDQAFPVVEIEGEVASFKVSQGKYVFFDLKDDESTVSCFMMVFALRLPVEDGMKVAVRVTPKLTKWGRFSLTVQAIRPLGEGSLKKSFQLQKAKLAKEGLFATERKRPLPAMPERIAIISSTQAAGYADFLKILDDRWGGVKLDVAQVQVQGDVAADQIIRALEYCNQQAELPELIVLLRGGGSADDLAVFNDELLVRAVAASRVPVVTGIGHEVDESLADLAADYAAATPSNAAQVIFPDRREVARGVRYHATQIGSRLEAALSEANNQVHTYLQRTVTALERQVATTETQLAAQRTLLAAIDPRAVLARGYAMVRGKVAIGQVVTIETVKQYITAEVTDVKNK